MDYKVDKPRKKPLLIATSGEDKIWLVGTSEEYNNMVITFMNGIENKDPRPLIQLYKWIDADEWGWLDSDKWSEEET